MTEEQIKKYLEEKFTIPMYKISALSVMLGCTERTIRNWITIGRIVDGKQVILESYILPDMTCRLIPRSALIDFFMRLNGL